MLFQFVVASIAVLMTVVIHAGGQAVGLRWLIAARARRLHVAVMWIRSLVVGILILVMFVATLVEAGVWATAYLTLGAIPKFEEALYFSVVTYTTLGYGDIVLDDQWRLLSSFQAANGVIVFGWTTALAVVALRQFGKTLRRLESMNDRRQDEGLSG